VNATGESDAAQIFLLTGEALSQLGDRTAAMERFRRALTLPGSDRVGVRLAIAEVMAQKNQTRTPAAKSPWP